MTINTNLVCELQNAVKVQYLDGNLFSQDVQGNIINVTVLDGGEPATLAGSVSANIIRADGQTVAATGGSFSGNVASITLPAAAYSVPGVASIVVKITDSGVTTTIAAVVANIYQSSTDTVVDPGTIIPSVQTLIAEIEDVRATIPPDYSSLWSSLAPNYSNLAFPVYTGYLCTYDGHLYRAKGDIPTSETWNSAHWDQTDFGSNITDLRGIVNRNVTVAGASILDISDFDTTTDANVTYSVSGDKITVTNGSTNTYACIQTSDEMLAKLVPGRMYRFHARCSVTSGNAIVLLTAKAGNTFVNPLYIGINGQGVLDFEMSSSITSIAMLVAWGSSTQGSVVEFSELWVKEMGKDTVARNDIIDLKSALYYQVPASIQAITGVKPMLFEYGYFTKTSAPGEAVEKTSSSTWSTAYFPVVEGDEITIDVTGASSTQRAWVFVNSSGNAISRGIAGLTGKRTITAPEGAVYCGVNNRFATQPTGFYAYIGKTVEEIEDEIYDKLDTKLDTTFDVNFDWKDITTEAYPLGWQKGYYSSGTGSTGASNDDIRTIRGQAYVAKNGDDSFTLTVPAGYHAQISEYNEAGTWQRTIGHHETGANVAIAELTEGYMYKFTVGGFNGDAGDYLTEEFIATVTGTISKDFISWQKDQDDRITALESGESEIPEYYIRDGWLQGRLDAITAIQNGISENQDSFWLISDYHHQYNNGNSIPLLKYLAKRTGINKIFFAGDAGGASGTSASARYHRLQMSADSWGDMASCTNYFFGVLGNHEWINTGTITEAGVMGTYLNRYKISYDVDAGTGDYVVNNKANKIRYYFIQDENAAYPVTGSLQWLYNDLLTLPDGWSVSVVMHNGWVSPTFFEEECDGATIEYNRPTVKFISTMLNAFREHMTATYNNVDYDFTGRTETNYVIGVFCGHLHHGLLFPVDNEYNTLEILTFMASTDCMHAASVAVDGLPWYWENGIVDGTKVVREGDTVTEQCFYAVQIDLDAKKVYITAVGGDHDYEADYET